MRDIRLPELPHPAEQAGDPGAAAGRPAGAACRVALRCTALQRLEYRGYDSAGVGLDRARAGQDIILIKTQGKVAEDRASAYK